MDEVRSEDGQKRGKSASLGALFLTVFLDMLAFGMFIPDLQLRAQSFGSSDLQIGFALAVFSIAQLLTAPIMGRLSDQTGRRRVLLVSSALSVVSYVIYAHILDFSAALNISPLWVMYVSRALSGIAAANLGVAFAYVADVTTPENRAKGLGLVGMAFGLGFVLGPPLGALLLKLGNNSPMLLGYFGAVLVFINFFYIWLLLPESHAATKERAPGLVANAKMAFGDTNLRLLLIMFFAVNIGFTNLETTFFRLLADPRTVFHLTEEDAKRDGAIILFAVGIGIAFCQGFLIRKLQPKLGEVKLLRLGYLLLIPGLILCPISPLWIPTLFVIFLLSMGNGLSQPSLSSLISRSAPKEMQGGIFGINQALGAFARCIGPIVSNQIFRSHPSYPYILGAAIIALPAVASWTLKQPAGHDSVGEEILAH